MLRKRKTNAPLPITYDPRQWTRLEKNSIPLYVNRDKPDWFVPNRAGDELLKTLAPGAPVPTNPEARLFLQRLPESQPADLSLLPTSLTTDYLRECWLHITNNCNQACSHCLFSCAPGRKEELSSEQIFPLADEAAALGCRVFALTGGEPLVHPHFAAIVNHLLSGPEIHVAVLTNGMLLRRYADDLAHWPATNFHLQISIDGIGATHDRFRGQGAFDRLMEELLWLNSQSIPFTLSMCVTDDNLRQMPAMIDLAAEVGAANVHFMWYFIRGRGQVESFVLPAKIFSQLQAAEARAAQLDIGIDNLEALKTQIFAPPGTIHWSGSSAWESVAIGPDRRLYPSPALIGIPELGHEMTADLATSWRTSPILATVRHASAITLDHPLRFILGGGDPDHSYMHSGTFAGNDPYWPLYEETALWLITREAEQQPDSGSPRLRLKMGDVLESCGAHGREALVHSNCLLSLTQPNSRTVVKSFYSRAAAAPNQDILNPVDYPAELVSHIPQASQVRSYGCGSPVLDAELEPGEYLVDLGSGSGVECFIAARLVGRQGKVTGIDMLEPMLDLAEKSALLVRKNLGFNNLTFTKGYLENLPLDDQSADAVISNCVLNLSTNKRRTFREIYRVIKPGGRLVVADVVCETEPDPGIRSDETLRGECIAGAMTQKDLFGLLRESGFINLQVLKRFPYRIVNGHHFYSLTFMARKPEPEKITKMIYRGPFTAVLTADNRLLTAGITYELPDSLLKGCGEEIFRLDDHGFVTNVDLGESCCALPPEAFSDQQEASPPAGESARHAVDCMVCGEPLTYLHADEEKTCYYCGQLLVANAVCKAGHFVCDRCHGQDALQIIEHLCITSAETDMIALLQQIRSHPTVPVHGPEHHALVPGIILATYKNLGGEITIDTIKTGIARGAKVPGGFCGFYGVCGAALGGGIAFGLILQSTPLKAAARQRIQHATQTCLADIAALEAARCCQRDSWLALRKAAEISKTLLPLPLHAEAPLRCRQMGVNPTCIGSDCPLFP